MYDISSKNSTKDYIISHKRAVQRWMQRFGIILLRRGEDHDNSKLEEPEFSGWCKMDEEPRYPYGSYEYKDKVKRFNPLFIEHWRKNRHHPEYFNYNFNDMDLIDIIEMMCDWLGYRDNITYTEASQLVSTQCDRYGFSDELKELILNTLKNHFVSFGGVFAPNGGPFEGPMFKDYDPDFKLPGIDYDIQPPPIEVDF